MDGLTITFRPSPKLSQLVAALGPEGRKTLNAGAAANLFAVVRDHIRRDAARRHATARKLGAAPTGHLEKAAGSVQKASDETGATVSVSSPGFGRVFRALHVRPVRARSLTIPVHALGYGRRASEVAAAHPLFRPKGKDYLMADIDGEATVIYLLRRAVTVPQDRTLLPSDADLDRAAKQGYKEAIRLSLEAAAAAPEPERRIP